MASQALNSVASHPPPAPPLNICFLALWSWADDSNSLDQFLCKIPALSWQNGGKAECEHGKRPGKLGRGAAPRVTQIPFILSFSIRSLENRTRVDLTQSPSKLMQIDRVKPKNTTNGLPSNMAAPERKEASWALRAGRSPDPEGLHCER